MTTAFEELKTKDTTKLREKLYNHLEQAEYFRRRNAKKLITPKEQEYIRSVFAQFGYEVSFDKIVKEVLW